MADPDWTVSGSGTPICDGDYAKGGTLNGKDYFEKVGGGKFLWWDDFFATVSWVISTDLGGFTKDYVGLKWKALPANPWTVTSGDAPAPTVAAWEAGGGAAPLVRRFNPRLILPGNNPGFM